MRAVLIPIISWLLIVVALTSPNLLHAETPMLAGEWNVCCSPKGERQTLFEWGFGSDQADAEPGESTEDDTIETDRPDTTEASTTVGKGRLQIEGGYTYVRDRSNGETVEAHSFPETLVRIGLLAEWFELRIGQNYGIADSFGPGGTTSAAGFDDLYLGVKLALTQQCGILPEIALMPQMTVPTGADDFTADSVLFGVVLLYGWDLTDKLSTAGMTAINQQRDGLGDTYAEVTQTWTVGYGLTEKLGAYTEWFAFIPSGALDAAVGPEHYFNGGFTYLVNDNFQLDIRAGFGLNHHAADFFTGAGFAVRF